MTGSSKRLKKGVHIWYVFNTVANLLSCADVHLQKSPMIDFDFNITHDGDWVAIAFRGTLQPQHQPVAPSIGVDVMEIHLPRFENTVQDFVSTMDMTLTSRERQWVLKEYTTDTFKTKISPPNSLSNHEFDQLKKLYTLWTYKEAFTKAKGMGLGFDFQTIDIEKEANSIAIKAGGQLQKGWKIYEMVLTPGKSANRRVGGGTGMESLLVVVEDTKEDDPVSLKTIDMEQAQQEGLLRIWTMENLVKASKQLIDKR